MTFSIDPDPILKIEVMKFKLDHVLNKRVDNLVKFAAVHGDLLKAVLDR